ncbi:MAG: hypothetical protein QOJ92_16 [Frankiales bacterium]|nr:hypothetical protein [Frankiales bacterium]
MEDIPTLSGSRVSVLVMRRTSTLTLADGTEIDIVRSTRRRRSVSAYREAGRTVLLAPERMSLRELTQAAEELHARLVSREAKRRPSDAHLLRRCEDLARRWLEGGELPETVRWVSNMRTRWASCTPVDRAIRVSDRLRDAPEYVLDYVLVHELAHLVEPNHNARFWALVEPFPQTETARAWLEGFTAGERIEPSAAESEANGGVDPAPVPRPASPRRVARPGVAAAQGALFSVGGSPASSSEERSSGAERSA